MADYTSPISRADLVAEISKRISGAEIESEAATNDLPLREDGAVTEDTGNAAESEDSESTSDDIRTLSDLAGAIGVDPEELYRLEFTLAGTGETLKLGEVKDKLQGLQKDRDQVKVERERLQQERAAWQSQAQQWLTAQQQTTAEFDKARLEAMQAEADIERVDWDTFQKTDPARAAWEYSKMLRRQQAAAQKFEKAQADLDRQRYEAAQTGQQQQQQWRAEQDAQLLEHVPEWRDPDQQQAELEGIWKWNQEHYGFTAEELSTAIDWRHRDMIRKAYLYDQLKAKKTTLEKTPKTGLKAAAIKRSTSDDRIKALIQRAQTSRHQGDKLAAAKAILERGFKR